jgi:hypothetical protein
VTLSAVGRYDDGRTAPVPATWSTDNAAVATVDQSGRLTAVRIGHTAVTAISENLSATQDAAVNPGPNAPWVGEFSGTWSGDSTELSCSRISGTGPSPCEGQERGGGRFPTTLTIRQQANAVTSQTLMNVFTGTLTGWVDGTGHLYLSGQVSQVEAGVSKLRDSDFSISPGGTLVGTYSWIRTFTNAWGQQVLRQDWRLLDRTR